MNHLRWCIIGLEDAMEDYPRLSIRNEKMQLTDEIGTDANWNDWNDYRRVW